MMKRAKRYLVVYDAMGEAEVWIQHADGSVRLSALNAFDALESDTPALDLRSDREGNADEANHPVV